MCAVSFCLVLSTSAPLQLMFCCFLTDERLLGGPAVSASSHLTSSHLTQENMHATHMKIDVCSLQPRSPRPPTLQVSASASDRAGVGLLRCMLAGLLSTLDVRRAGLVLLCVTSVFGGCHLPKHLRLATSSWMTSVDFHVHLHKLEVQVLPFRSLDAFVHGLTTCVPPFVHKGSPPSAGLHFGGVE